MQHIEKVLAGTINAALVANIHFTVLGVAMIAYGTTVHAQDAAKNLAGPNATANVLALDTEDKSDVLDIDEQAGFAAWKAGVKERTGLDFGIDYNTLGYYATNSVGDDICASGAFRVFGTLDLFRRGTPNNGSIIFKIENRHAYTDVSPQAFGGQLGYVGNPRSVFSDQGWRVTPSIQYINNPALNPVDDSTLLLGLRLRGAI